RTRRSGQVGYGRAVAHGVNTMTGSAKPRRPDGASWLAGAGSRCLWVVLAGRRGGAVAGQMGGADETNRKGDSPGRGLAAAAQGASVCRRADQEVRGR